MSYCGDRLTAQIYGNAPCGFFKYKYPREVQNKNGVIGGKVNRKSIFSL